MQEMERLINERVASRAREACANYLGSCQVKEGDTVRLPPRPTPAERVDYPGLACSPDGSPTGRLPALALAILACDTNDLAYRTTHWRL
jgi:hypothetical protein